MFIPILGTETFPRLEVGMLTGLCCSRRVTLFRRLSVVPRRSGVTAEAVERDRPESISYTGTEPPLTCPGDPPRLDEVGRVTKMRPGDDLDDVTELVVLAGPAPDDCCRTGERLRIVGFVDPVEAVVRLPLLGADRPTRGRRPVLAREPGACDRTVPDREDEAALGRRLLADACVAGERCPEPGEFIRRPGDDAEERCRLLDGALARDRPDEELRLAGWTRLDGADRVDRPTPWLLEDRRDGRRPASVIGVESNSSEQTAHNSPTHLIADIITPPSLGLGWLRRPDEPLIVSHS